MLLKLLKYTFEIKHLPGNDMYLANTLSRAYIKEQRHGEESGYIKDKELPNKDVVEDDPKMSQTIHSVAKYL